LGRRNRYCWKNRYCGKFCKIGKRVQLKDHSIFVAFAPKDNQNCHRHFSGKWWLWTTIAGPIASLMIEKYLRKK
jgi:penicillin-binding protein 2